jgi:type II secretory pathway component PulJ
MKPIDVLRRLLRTLLAFVAAAAIHGLAPAQSNPPATEAWQPPLPSDLVKYDSNHNGHLEPSEKKALIRERMLQRREERAARARAVAEARKGGLAAHYAKQKISPALLKQYDRNQNGRLGRRDCGRHCLASAAVLPEGSEIRSD